MIVKHIKYGNFIITTKFFLKKIVQENNVYHLHEITFQIGDNIISKYQINNSHKVQNFLMPLTVFLLY